MRVLQIAALALLVTVASAMPARAQSFPDEFTWGVQGGLGMGYGTVPPDSGTTREMGSPFAGGIFAAIPIGGGFRFQPEFKFDHREVTIGGITTKANYLSVPLLFRNDFLGIFMTQGVSLNFLRSATVLDNDFKDAYTSLDYGIIMGLGKTVGRVSLEGRWDTGLRSFQKDIGVGGVRHRALTGVVSVHLK
ncbi:MAG: outer membrane beta-barrel protein [Vicinamibacterales bacterium]